MKTPIETLIKALHILANDIQSNDGVANAAISEAANRLDEQQNQIQRLVEAGDRAIENSYYPDRVKLWTAAKERL